MTASQALDPVSDLIRRLRAVRDAHADATPDAVRDALERALDHALAGQPEDEAARRIEAARASLVEEARGRLVRLEAAERAKVALEAERDRLAAEVATLRQSAAPPGEDDSIRAIRQALLQVAHGTRVDANALPLSPDRKRFFRLFQELLEFAMRIDEAVQFFQIQERGGGSTIMKGVKREVQKRFRDSLDNKEGSVAGLRDKLLENTKFLVSLAGAYRTAATRGGKQILSELDPEPIAQEHRSAMLGVNYEKAWRKLEDRHQDLTILANEEIWEQFFQEPFLGALKEQLDKASPTQGES